MAVRLAAERESRDRIADDLMRLTRVLSPLACAPGGVSVTLQSQARPTHVVNRAVFFHEESHFLHKRVWPQRRYVLLVPTPHGLFRRMAALRLIGAPGEEISHLRPL